MKRDCSHPTTPEILAFARENDIDISKIGFYGQTKGKCHAYGYLYVRNTAFMYGKFYKENREA